MAIEQHFDLKAALEALRVLRESRLKPGVDPGDLSTSTDRGNLLEAIAKSLDDGRADIIRVAAAETALTPAELDPEFDRMVGTLRMFAGVAREGTWVRAVVNEPWHGRLDRETRDADTGGPPVPRPPVPLIGPNHDIRSMLVPLGPVVVFGASNFPLAYGVCGGDTASALAAGCPVVVKEHPAHTNTGRLIVRMARHGIKLAGGDETVLGYAIHVDPTDLSTAHALVNSPLVKAVGFTGSRRAGLAIEELARARSDRIPVFAEMGSANPVIVTPAAAAARGREIGEQLGDSILARFGQQCTCPGIIVVPDAAGAGKALVDALAARIAAAASGGPRDMLARWIRDGYVGRLRESLAGSGVRLLAGCADPHGSRGAYAALLGTSAEIFGWRPELREEIFGPGAIVVDGHACTPDACADIAGLPLPASLTLSIFFEAGDPADVMFAGRIARTFQDRAGRIIFNGVPTGVRVAEAMVHGGPFPASNRPDTTAVGPRAIERWCRPVCWQGGSAGLLPVGVRGG